MATPKPRLDVRDLELVLAVARAGSTVKAASALHLTQSAVSRGVLLAEEKLGVVLFERTARGLSPTEAGRRLVGGATSVLTELVELERVAVTPTRTRARVRLACECYTAYRWLPSTLATLERASQGLDVTLLPEHSAAPLEALVAGDLDVALLTTSATRGAIRELPLFADEVVFVVSTSHPLAARPSLAREDLTSHRLITSTQTPQPEVRWFMETVFGRGARPRLDRLRFPLTEAIVDATRAGMGVAVLSEWIASPYLESGDLVMKRLGRRVIKRPWRIAFRKESEASARRLAFALERAAPRAYPA